MEKKITRKRFSEEFKLSVLRDYYSSGMTKYACYKKYHLSQTALSYWLKQYENETKSLSLPQNQDEEDVSKRSKESYKVENQELKKRIRDLEKALEFSKLETLARDMMIDKAEEYFDIRIRKKSGAK